MAPKYGKVGQNRRKLAPKVRKSRNSGQKIQRVVTVPNLPNRPKSRKSRPETQKKPKKTALYRGGHRIKESRGNTAVIRRAGT